jgi:hypothetical protein
LRKKQILFMMISFLFSGNKRFKTDNLANNDV